MNPKESSSKAVLKEKLKGAQCSEIQCAQHVMSMKKQRFSSHPRTKVRPHGHRALLEHSFE